MFRKTLLVLAIGSAVLTFAEPSRAESTPAVTMQKATQLALHGEADLALSNKYLAQFGMEAVPLPSGSAEVVIVNNHYPKARFFKIIPSVLPFSQTFVGIVARNIGDKSNRYSYIFLGNYNSSSIVLRLFQTFWGVPSVRADFDLSKSIVDGGHAVLTVDQKPVLELKMGAASAKPFQKKVFNYDGYGISIMNGKQTDYHFIGSVPAQVRDYDSNVDSYDAPLSTELGRTLREIDFQPKFWDFSDEMTAGLFLPNQG